MRDLPLLDPRTEADILRKLAELAESYTPEWRMDLGDMDAGAALAVLFARMHAGTVERFNGALYKYYIEFLNLLGVTQNPVTPAGGYVCAQLAAGAADNVELARDTELYREDAQGERVYYMTDESISLTPACITAMISVDPRSDRIAVIKPQTEADADGEHEPFSLFYVREEDDMQRHRFSFAHADALSLSLPCVIEVEPRQNMAHLQEAAAERLSDTSFAKWEYCDGESWRAFDAVRAKDGRVLLIKDDGRTIAPEAEPEDDEADGGVRAAIRCTMRGGQTALSAKSLCVRPVLGEDTAAAPDLLYANDEPVDPRFGGYCFSPDMVPYDAFYIASEEIFVKRGARVEIAMHMRTVTRVSDSEESRIEFRDKMVIDKEDAPPPPPSKFVSRVVWEYWNGAGWAHLPVEGDINPFGDSGDGDKHLSFICPVDIARGMTGAIENLWIRARVLEVENPFHPYATLLLPYLQRLRLRFAYAAPMPVTALCAENNLRRAAVADTGGKEIALTLYEPPEDENPALYLIFDGPVRGLPLNLYFDFIGRVREKRQARFEVFTGRRFEPIKTLSRIEGCAASGPVSLYLPNISAPFDRFGTQGFALRVTDAARGAKTSYPLLRRIVCNAVPVTQRQIAPEMYFSTQIHEAGKQLRLNRMPVLMIDLWVDEPLSEQAREELRASCPEDIREEFSQDRRPLRFWVRWREAGDLSLRGPRERVYQIDRAEGIISFGDGVCGRVPPAGEDNIHIRASFGGGSIGNAPVGALTGITTTQPSIDRVENFTPLSGGNDIQSIELVERIGPHRLRHRGRAVTAADYESLTLEGFSEVHAVRCFPNRNESGAYESGAVTVALLCRGYANEVHCLSMCERVYADLAARCDGALVRNGRLHVVPARIVSVNVTATLEMISLENAAATERACVDAIDAMLNPLRPGLVIGRFPAQADFYAQLRRVDNVAAVRDVLLEGAYFDYNSRRVTAIDAGSPHPYAVPCAGEHLIRL